MKLLFSLLLALVCDMKNAIEAEPAYTKCTFPLKPMAGFVPPLFEGLWYWDSASLPHWSRITCEQTRYTYSSKTNRRGQHSDHFATVREFWIWGGSHYRINGRMKTLDPNERARFHGKTGRQEINWWLIDTDYKNYTLAYICHHHYHATADEAVALTRDPHGLTSAQRQTLQDILKREGFPHPLIRISTHSCGLHNHLG